MGLRFFLCKAADLPAEGYRVFEVTGLETPVLLALVEGELVATQGICPHEDVGLDGGDFDGRRLTCPGHAYEFDLATGRCLHDRSLELRLYKIWQSGDDVYVEVV